MQMLLSMWGIHLHLLCRRQVRY